MKTVAVRNFHIPLPEHLYLRLKEAAQRERRPATQLAKQAVEYWLMEQEKLALHRQISEYAAQVAGTEADLDQELEDAALQQLVASEEETGGVARCTGRTWFHGPARSRREGARS